MPYVQITYADGSIVRREVDADSVLTIDSCARNADGAKTASRDSESFRFGDPRRPAGPIVGIELDAAEFEIAEPAEEPEAVLVTYADGSEKRLRRTDAPH